MYERSLLATLKARVLEPRRFIQVIVGPRQVGKTTLLTQLTDSLDQAKNGDADVHPTTLVVSVSADAMSSSGSSWLDQVWEDTRTKLRLTSADEALLCFDEVQKVAQWSESVKRNWDLDTKEHRPIKVVLSGSSRLLIQDGLTESLTGRFESHYLGHWSYTEMAEAFGLSPEQYAWFGGYPGAASLIDDEPRFKSYVTAAIIETSLNRDIFLMTKIDKPALLRNVFELGTAYSGQILSLTKMLGQLQDAGNTTTLARYLHLLDQAGLLAGLQAASSRPVATRASSPKYQTHNMALYSANRSDLFSSARSDSSAWGRVVESAVGAHLIAQTRMMLNTSLDYWREGDKEVDFVVRQGETMIGLEVKSAPGSSHLQGLTAFEKRFPQARTLLVGGAALSWEDFLRTDLCDLIAAMF